MVCIPNLSRLRLSTLTIATNTETSTPQKRPHESSDSSDGDDSPKESKRKRSDSTPNQAVVDGAKAIWQRMRQLEKDGVAEAVPEPSEEERKQVIRDAEALLKSAELREAQIRLITERYQAFVASIDKSSNEWNAVHRYVHEGQSTVNDYLTWQPDKEHSDPTDYYEWLHKSTQSDDEEDDPDLRENALWRRPEQQLFYLYGLLNRCPQLHVPVTLLRSVRYVSRLLHNPPGTESVAGTLPPTDGKANLNTCFVSTSLAPLDDYLSWRGEPPPLSNFYNQQRGCCMSAITVDAGVQVLPIIIDNDEWSKPGEQEVLLPPGLVYVFQGIKEITIKNEKKSKAVGKEWRHKFSIFFYRAMLPHSQQKNCADYSPIDNCSNSATVS